MTAVDSIIYFFILDCTLTFVGGPESTGPPELLRKDTFLKPLDSGAGH